MKLITVTPIYKRTREIIPGYNGKQIIFTYLFEGGLKKFLSIINRDIEERNKKIFLAEDYTFAVLNVEELGKVDNQELAAMTRDGMYFVSEGDNYLDTFFK